MNFPSDHRTDQGIRLHRIGGPFSLYRCGPLGLLHSGAVEPKTVQGILRHSRIQTTLDLYAQDDSDETRAAQGEYLTALGVGTHMVQ